MYPHGRGERPLAFDTTTPYDLGAADRPLTTEHGGAQMDEMEELLEAVLETETQVAGTTTDDGPAPLSTVGELPALPQWQ
jgi:hypothetical protein